MKQGPVPEDWDYQQFPRDNGVMVLPGVAHDLQLPFPASLDELQAERERTRKMLREGRIVSTVLMPRSPVPYNAGKLLA